MCFSFGGLTFGFNWLLVGFDSAFMLGPVLGFYFWVLCWFCLGFFGFYLAFLLGFISFLCLVSRSVLCGF